MPSSAAPREWGLGLAQRLVERGDRVLIGGRNSERLEAATRQLGPLATARSVDIEDRASLASFFYGQKELAGLFTPGTTYRTASFRGADAQTAESPFRAKFWGQYWAVHTALPHFAKNTAIVLMSGAASVRPGSAIPPIPPAMPQSRGLPGRWPSN